MLFELNNTYKTNSHMGGTTTYKLISIKNNILTFKNIMHKDYGGGEKITFTAEQATNYFYTEEQLTALF